MSKHAKRPGAEALRFRCDAALLARMQAAAEADNGNVSEFIRRCICNELDRLEQPTPSPEPMPPRPPVPAPDLLQLLANMVARQAADSATGVKQSGKALHSITRIDTQLGWVTGSLALIAGQLGIKLPSPPPQGNAK